jgi:hypothetical protein
MARPGSASAIVGENLRLLGPHRFKSRHLDLLQVFARPSLAAGEARGFELLREDTFIRSGVSLEKQQGQLDTARLFPLPRDAA